MNSKQARTLVRSERVERGFRSVSKFIGPAGCFCCADRDTWRELEVLTHEIAHVVLVGVPIESFLIRDVTVDAYLKHHLPSYSARRTNEWRTIAVTARVLDVTDYKHSDTFLDKAVAYTTVDRRALSRVQYAYSRQETKDVADKIYRYYRSVLKELT